MDRWEGRTGGRCGGRTPSTSPLIKKNKRYDHLAHAVPIFAAEYILVLRQPTVASIADALHPPSKTSRPEGSPVWLPCAANGMEGRSFGLPTAGSLVTEATNGPTVAGSSPAATACTEPFDGTFDRTFESDLQ